MPSGPPPEELCRRLKASDREAFEAIFRLFRGDLLRFATAIVEDATVAHDLVQDVFVSLWGLRETLDPSKSLRAYLFRMTRNRAYRHLRDERTHARKHTQLGDEAAARPPAEVTNGHDAALLADRLQAWIAALPARQREALLLSRFHELSHREIAAVMDISPRTVNNHIVRALEHLQRCLEAFEPSLLER
ncbi:RNA polymerase sigma-70 factor [Rhodocaloribacter litoris]|uniref:RNA polymerase sigma factor n=1 Tax=Rhodocaloribacter litoris TaxID=2558931 RepID=UPI00141FB5B5|nr:RNA polymerase sigma-70 factor [Rhodocaloribacter litoris]QXD16655.1 RNA polymerase sigma-70 factor [Rhodocaloribacter litoris]